MLVLLALFGGWKLYQVHNAQNNVDALQSEYRHAQRPGAQVRPGGSGQQCLHGRRHPTGVGAQRRRRLAARTQQPDLHHAGQCPGDIFSGHGHRSGRLQPAQPAQPRPAASAQPLRPRRHRSSIRTSAAIGTIQLGVIGPGPSLSISEAWINAVAGSQLFANPVQGATVANPDTTISFPFSISITPNASLDKNASLK